MVLLVCHLNSHHYLLMKAFPTQDTLFSLPLVSNEDSTTQRRWLSLPFLAIVPPMPFQVVILDAFACPHTICSHSKTKHRFFDKDF